MSPAPSVYKPSSCSIYTRHPCITSHTSIYSSDSHLNILPSRNKKPDGAMHPTDTKDS